MAAMFALHLLIGRQGGPAWTPSSLRLRVDCSMPLILVGTLVIGQRFARNLLGRLPAARQSSPASPDRARGAVALTLLWAAAFGLLVALEWAIRSRSLPDATAAPMVLLVPDEGRLPVGGRVPASLLP